MAKKNKSNNDLRGTELAETIIGEVVETTVDEIIEEEVVTNEIDNFRKELGCNIYLERTVQRTLGSLDNDSIKVVKLVKRLNRHYDRNTLLVDIEKVGKELLSIIKGE